MIRITFCLTRKEGMALDGFQDYWLTKHAPLVKSVADTLHIRRYVQLHTRNRRRQSVAGGNTQISTCNL